MGPDAGGRDGAGAPGGTAGGEAGAEAGAAGGGSVSILGDADAVGGVSTTGGAAAAGGLATDPGGGRSSWIGCCGATSGECSGAVIGGPVTGAGCAAIATDGPDATGPLHPGMIKACPTRMR